MEENVYFPNKHLKLGVRIWPRMFRDLIRSRELIWRLFLRNLAAKYKQAVLGYLWAFIMPFIPIGTFMFLNRAGIVNIGSTDMPYALFALIGLSIWQLFSVGIISGTNSIVSAGSVVSRINFPREVLVFASMAESIFEFLTKSVLIVLFFFAFKFRPSWCTVFFPLALIPILILTLGLSLLLSLINGVLRDTANVVSLLVTFLMFLTPVLYPISGAKALIFKLNPISPLITAPRDLIAHGCIKDPAGFVVATVLSFVLFFVAWRIFYIAETKIPERL